MHLPLRINSYRRGQRRLFPTTGKFMNEAVNDTSLYFRLLVTVKPLSLQYFCKTELFATDTRLLLMYIRKSNEYTDQRAAIVYFSCIGDLSRSQ